MKKKIGLMMLIVGMSSTAKAVDISWDYGSAKYVSTEVIGETLDGYMLELSTLLTESIYIRGSHLSISMDERTETEVKDISFQNIFLGVGAKTEFTDDTSGYLELNHYFSKSEVYLEEIGGGVVPSSSIYSETNKDHGFAVSTGLRSMITENIEVEVSAMYHDNSVNDGITGLFSTYYHLDDEISLGFDFEYSDENNVKNKVYMLSVKVGY
jgi:hypothetical protein